MTRRTDMFNSIRSKLIFLITTLLTLISAVIFASTIYFFNDYTSKTALEEANSGTEGMKVILGDACKEMKLRAIMLAENPEVAKAVEAKDSAAVLAIMQRICKDIPVDSITISDQKGIVIARTHDPGKKGDSVLGQNNVREALKGNVTTGVESGTVVKLSARAGAPVRNSAGEIVGVITPGVTLSKNEVVDRIKQLFGVDATLFLNDVRETTTIAVDGQRQVGTKLDPKIADIVLQQGKPYQGSATIFNKPYVTSYQPLQGPDGKTIGLIFSGKSLQEVTATQYKMTFTILAIAVTTLLLALFCTFILAKKITGPLENLNLIVAKVAKGDLTSSVELDSSDEIGLLAKNFNIMLFHLRELVNQVHNLSQTLAAASQQLTANADQSVNTSNQVSSSINTVAKGAQQQLLAVGNATENVSQVSVNLQQVAKNANTMADSSVQAAEKARSGGKSIGDAVSQMSQIENTVNSSAKIISELGDRSNEIGQIVDAISALASQTNLLALNAAIEAARAGEQGRGFAVVAEEVRKLAEQSQEAAKKIAVLIGEIQANTSQAVTAMTAGTNEVRIGANVVNAAGVAFN